VTVPLSYWHDSLAPGDDGSPRPPLSGDTDVDVAIVGAGFTGLWTAYYLRRADPSLRVVVLERETAGFGASGRNGGWCIGDPSGPDSAVEKARGAGAAEAMARALHAAVDEVGSVSEREGIDCGWSKAGAIIVARNRGQLARLRREQSLAERYGYGDAWTMLDRDQTTSVVHMAGAIGALMTSHAAALHPARLARGLASAVERHGGVIREQTTVRSIDGRHVRTDHGTVRAEVVVRATEAYSVSIAGHERTILPLGNYVVATEPIDDATWAALGLANRELFEVAVNMVAYGQRTADGRIVFGGLSGPTWWQSRIPASPMRDHRVERRLRKALQELFPPLRDVTFTHQWGGVLGVPRDLLPGVGYDRETGEAWAGGYFGQGVASANAAGRTLADLVRGEESEMTRLPWVGHRSPPWEPEPVRWLGVHTAATLARARDWIDTRRS
jgi:glycine/D-amino acid oxidase-like deaminating enzyme